MACFEWQSYHCQFLFKTVFQKGLGLFSIWLYKFITSTRHHHFKQWFHHVFLPPLRFQVGVTSWTEIAQCLLWGSHGRKCGNMCEGTPRERLVSAPGKQASAHVRRWDWSQSQHRSWHWPAVGSRVRCVSRESERRVGHGRRAWLVSVERGYLTCWWAEPPGVIALGQGGQDVLHLPYIGTEHMSPRLMACNEYAVLG